MMDRRTALALAAASLWLLARPAFAQNADAPAAKPDVTPRTAHPKKRAKPTSKSAAKPASKPAVEAAPAAGAESEAASLERRRRAFFANEPNQATPDAETPSAGVTLGGSGGLSPGMGFKF